MDHPNYPPRKGSDSSTPQQLKNRAPPPPYTPYANPVNPPHPIENPYPIPNLNYNTGYRTDPPIFACNTGYNPHQGTQASTMSITETCTTCSYSTATPVCVTVSATVNCHGVTSSHCPHCHCCECTVQEPFRPSPTVIPVHPFIPQHDAEELKRAMKGKTDDKTIIEILANRTNRQRLEISHAFSILYGKELVNALQNEVKGKFEDVLVAMMTPIPEFYANELYQAITGERSDEVLVEVFCTLSNAEIRDIKATYDKIFCSSLDCGLRDNTHCTFRHLMASLAHPKRDEITAVNTQMAHADAKSLHKARDRRFSGHDSTFNSTFNHLIRHRSYAQLRSIFDEYRKISGHKFEKTIKKEIDDELKDAYLSIVKAIRNPAAFFAKRLRHRVHKKNDMIRIVVTRSEIDLGDIKREYAEKFKKSLAHSIKNDCSGDYKRCLLELTGAAEPYPSSIVPVIKNAVLSKFA